MKIYFPKNLYFKNNRNHLFPLLKPFLKNASFTDEQRIKMYRVSSSDYEISDSITEAEIIVLPMSWNYYFDNELKKEALNFIEFAKKQKRKSLVFYQW